LNSVIEGNVASLTDSGLGGGICVGQSAPSGTHIVGNMILGNIASTASDSPGVGMVFGDGGGLYVTHVPGAVIEDNTFEGNVGSNGSGGPEAVTVGGGGGLYVYDSAGVVLRRNEFVRNTASHGWYAFAGDGGGAFLYWADGATVADNLFAENLAALHSMCAGGGLLVLLSDDVLIDGNEVTENWACLVGTDAADNRGGGIMVVTFDGVTVSDNILFRNTTAVSGPNIGTSAGGGLNVEDGQDVQVTGNTIQRNTACQTGIGYGGGTSIWGVKDNLVADNLISDNVGSLSGAHGYGGGLNLRLTQNCTVRNNHFQGNLAVAEGTGLVGGGGVSISLDQWYSPSVNTTLEANSFFGNKDSADPNQPSLGGGACFARSDGFTFTNNVVADNTGVVGSALFLGQTWDTAVTNNTLVGNNGASGVFVSPLNDPYINFTNNIVVSHTVGISVTEGAEATVRYTLWHGNDTDIGGGGVISHTHPVTGTPAFADPAADDYHITIGSAARDAGDPAGVPPAPSTDRDGVPRPQGPAVDIGAYEWRGYQLYLPLAMKDWRAYTGWAVGDSVDGYGTILHTTDSGETWVQQGQPGEVPDVHLNAVSAVDEANAWVVGQDVILRTRDGGQAWEQQPLPTGVPTDIVLLGVKAIDSNTAWAVGTPDVLLQTTDGQTWNVMPRNADLHLPWPVSYQDVDAVDATHVWAVGGSGATGRGQAVMAFYNGIEWHLQPTVVFTDPNSDAFIGVSVLDQDTVWAVGGWNMPLVKTTDGGASWQQGQPPIPGLFDANRVVAVTADIGWASGDNGKVPYTTDAGATWHAATIPASAYLFAVTAMDDQTAWVVGVGEHGAAPGVIARTRDAHHWEVQSDPSWPNMSGISFVGARR
jgi:photosystem II stability/assembly factor-like uncharacterized protein